VVQYHAEVHLAIADSLLLLLQLAVHVELKLHTVIVLLLFLCMLRQPRHCMCLANINVHCHKSETLKGNDIFKCRTFLLLQCRCDTAQHSPSWVPVAPMKIERGSLAVATVGDYIYAIGGGKPNVQYDSVERYISLLTSQELLLQSI